MTYTDRLNALYEEARREIVAAVEKHGQESPLHGRKVIPLPKGLNFYLDSGKEDFAYELSSENILNQKGHSFGYAWLKLSQLMEIADYVKAL